MAKLGTRSTNLVPKKTARIGVSFGRPNPRPSSSQSHAQNRRKSRMGHSLENHLAAVLRAHGIRHVRGAVTEHNHKPDFLFPDLPTYQAAPPEGDARLTMLGAKSSCKDRWRQVLAEAEKISRKHLLTLEPGISEPQTSQMEASSLQLVVPLPVQESYTAAQQGWLWSVADFIGEVRMRQA